MRASGYLPGALILIVVAAVPDWLGAGTARLYAGKANPGSVQAGSVRQEIKGHGKKVRPEIGGQGDARVRFSVDTRAPSRLLFAIEPAGPASYEIFVRAGGKRQRIAAWEGGQRQIKCSIPLPARVGELEFVQHGLIRWVDLRLVRPVFLWPIYALGLTVIVVLAARQMWARRLAYPEWMLLFASILLCLTMVELVLRRFSGKLPAAVTAARSELGAVGADPRWIDPGRYKLRLRPNLNTYAEWRYGAVVRLGFIPEEVSRGLL